jgi:hypothetical protein
MSKLMELLARWHKAEPELCRTTNPTYPETVYLVTTPREAWHIAATYSDLPVVTIRVQSVVQWAVSTKPDWQLILELNRHPNDGSAPRWTGRVYRPEVGEPFVSSPTSEPAEAVLEAYVMALEAGGEA